jgi:transposase-like protein
LNPTGTVCPLCGSPHSRKVKFTWWGGALGPALFSHVKCLACGAAYNSKTGKSNTAAVTLYVVITATIGVIGFALLIFLR